MTGRDVTRVTDCGPRPLPTRSLTRESSRAVTLVAAGEWRPTAADAQAATRVLARLTAPLPVRRGGSALTRATDRDRRLQRIWRTAVHHLDAGSVSPRAAALLAAVARALLPWHAAPNPPAAAAAPRYGTAAEAAGASATPPTDAGEALLPDLIALFALLAAPPPPGTVTRTPPAEPWEIRHAGRFRHYGRPTAGVWTADTLRCSGCRRTDGPWTVTCDWRLITLGCPCGVVTDRHGLAFSEIWLLLPDA